MQYLTLSKCFIAPFLIPEGTKIEYNGAPGPHLQPLDDEAIAAFAKWEAENPGATLHPVDALPMTMAEVTVLAPSAPAAEPVFNTLDPNAPPEPGLTAGGKAK